MNRDIINKRFGDWTILSFSKGVADCVCICGTRRNVSLDNVLYGSSKSCGCRRIAAAKITGAAKATHHMSGSRTYRTWQQAKWRCQNPRNKGYKNYGARGIYMDPRWAASFDEFFSDMGEQPEGMSIERLDVNGPYSKENCIWADATTQCRNRRSTVFVYFLGERHPLKVWCDRLGLEYDRAYRRLVRERNKPGEAFRLAALPKRTSPNKAKKASAA